jgi:hypothetical protein
MKKLLLFILTVSAFAQKDFRVGVPVNYTANAGYTAPSIGMSLNSDIRAKGLWFATSGKALYSSKQDGGKGVTWGGEGRIHVSVGKQTYVGGGILWSELRVEQYTKNAYHPVVEVGKFFKFNDTRDSLVFGRYILSGNDNRNRVREITSGVRLTLPNKFNFEPEYGVMLFHYTDNPHDKRIGIVMQVTLSRSF